MTAQTTIKSTILRGKRRKIDKTVIQKQAGEWSHVAAPGGWEVPQPCGRRALLLSLPGKPGLLERVRLVLINMDWYQLLIWAGGGHELCSGLSPGFVLRGHSWPMCQEPDPGQFYASLETFPLYCLFGFILTGATASGAEAWGSLWHTPVVCRSLLCSEEKLAGVARCVTSSEQAPPASNLGWQCAVPTLYPQCYCSSFYAFGG